MACSVGILINLFLKYIPKNIFINTYRVTWRMVKWINGLWYNWRKLLLKRYIILILLPWKLYILGLLYSWTTLGKSFLERISLYPTKTNMADVNENLSKRKIWVQLKRLDQIEKGIAMSYLIIYIAMNYSTHVKDI